ncbi:Abscisic acid receptor PYL4 [Striga hermonthica]|uniref:Abscisic acid receptor PYL4 n=1 Tax=Striga hermonthica TaxID=68872 RepID=A0A9N7NH29_STRHE|nr:Abscisic acid receptor PYL4 [Striga hermonthica]
MASSIQLHRMNPMNHPAARRAAAAEPKPARVCPVPQDVPAAPESVLRRHTHSIAAGQCCSAAVQAVDAPAEAVWSVLRRFDRPQAYKVGL